jgi:hypothetical protein
MASTANPKESKPQETLATVAGEKILIYFIFLVNGSDSQFSISYKLLITSVNGILFKHFLF